MNKGYVLAVLSLVLLSFSSAFVYAQTDEIPIEGFAFLGALFLISVIIGIAGYIYMGLAYMKIGQKSGITMAGLSWIPGLGPMLVAQRCARMHWWPFLLLLIPIIGVVYLIVIGATALVPSMVDGSVAPGTTPDFGVLGAGFLIVFLLTLLVALVLMIFNIVWHYKMFISVGRPGWWPVLAFLIGLPGFIPLIGLVFSLASFVLLVVFLGIAAWGKGGSRGPTGMIEETPIDEDE